MNHVSRITVRNAAKEGFLELESVKTQLLTVSEKLLFEILGEVNIAMESLKESDVPDKTYICAHSEESSSQQWTQKF